LTIKDRRVASESSINPPHRRLYTGGDETFQGFGAAVFASPARGGSLATRASSLETTV
jgi:hypothetical protein